MRLRQRARRDARQCNTTALGHSGSGATGVEWLRPGLLSSESAAALIAVCAFSGVVRRRGEIAQSAAFLRCSR
eukprot:3284107-Prymnesium_polylepis.1